MINYWRNFNIKEYNQLPDFDINNPDQYIVNAKNLIGIKNCTIRSIYDLKIENEHVVSFWNVKFIEHNNFFDSKHTVKYVNCLFEGHTVLDLRDRNEHFSNCVFLNSVEATIKEGHSLNITECKIQSVHIYCKKANELIIRSSFFNSMTLSPANAFSVEKDIIGQCNNFSFQGVVKDKLQVFNGLTFKYFNICFDYLSIDTSYDEINDKWLGGDEVEVGFGDLVIFGGEFLNGIQFNQTKPAQYHKYPELSDEEFVDYCNPVKKIVFHFGRELQASHINISLIRVNELEMKGINYNISLYVISCFIENVVFSEYLQNKDGLINIRNLLNTSGCIKAQDAIISNDNLFFQSSNLSNWTSDFKGSFFRYKAVGTEMPLKSFNSGAALLDDINIKLNSVSKSDNVLNWYDLKKEQWKIIWKERKDSGKITFSEKAQHFVQLLNDYGTNWFKPLEILFLLNIIIALPMVLISHNSFNGFTDYLGILVYQVYLQSNLFTISKLGLPDDQWSYYLLFIPLGVINSILLFQTITAFRKYFTNR